MVLTMQESEGIWPNIVLSFLPLPVAVSLPYLLTPWSRVLLEKLPGLAANQEIPRIFWNPKVH